MPRPRRGRPFAVAGSLLLLLGVVPGGPRSWAGEGEGDGEAGVAIRLVDATAEAGLAGAGGDRFSFGDFDGDGDPDLLVEGRRLWRNDTAAPSGGGSEALAPRPIRFTDQSAATGLDRAKAGGACWLDLDGDGRLDVVTTGGSLMRQGEDGRFEDVAAAWGLDLAQPAASLGAGDVDGDGRVDLLFGGGEDWNDGRPVFFARRLFRNVDGKRLEDRTADHDLAEPRYGRAVVFADFDGDGDQDVYCGNYRLQPNELLVNDKGRLKERGKRAGVQGRHEPERMEDAHLGRRFGPTWGHTIAASWADLDGDGDLDLWVSNLVHKYVGPYGPPDRPQYDVRGYLCDDSPIYENRGSGTPRFQDARPRSGIALKPTGPRGVFQGDELWSHAACGDLDGDGLPEVYVAQVYDLEYSHSLLFRNLGSFRFRDVGADVGVRRYDSYGGAFADLDGDGDLDLVTGGADDPKGKGVLQVWRNDTEPGPWVAFRLEGPPANRPAIGAQVIVETDRGTLLRQIEASMGSHAQQNEMVARFGLRGRALKAVRVRWPGGKVQEVPSPALGTVQVVRATTDSRTR